VTGARHASSPRGPGDAMVRAGAALFGLGGIGVLLTVLPYFFGDDDPALAWLVLASLMPFGLGLALLGLLRGARASRRRS
jgi:VIT1/CCC1 family predicted Fe2+/Mn2+ transporter